MRISDWISDVCSSDLTGPHGAAVGKARRHAAAVPRHLHDVAGRPQVDLRPGALGKGKGAIEAGAADRGVLDDPAERPGGVGFAHLRMREVQMQRRDRKSTRLNSSY